MTLRVKIPTQLRKLAGDRKELEIEPVETVRDVIDELRKQHPELVEKVMDENGDIRRFINVYVGDEDVRFLQGLDTPIGDERLISILPAVAGG